MAVAILLAQTHYVYRFILKGFDIQRQEAGILREGTEETRDRKKAAHMCFTAIFQAMERRPQIELPPQFNFVLVWAPWNSRA